MSRETHKSEPQNGVPPGTLPKGLFPLLAHDEDPQETGEWLDALDYVLGRSGPDRAAYLIQRLKHRAFRRGARLAFPATTPYVNTVPPEQEPPYPGDRHLERRIKSIIRWNAMAMAVRANQECPGIGGHISTYASAATLLEVGFNHFFRGKQGRRPAAAPEASPVGGAPGKGAVTAPAQTSVAEPQAAPSESVQPPAGSAPPPGGLIPAGPAVRRLARELGVDLHSISGSGKRGRITPEDVRAAAQDPGVAATCPAAASTPPAPRAQPGEVTSRRGRPTEPAALAEPVLPPGEPGEDQWGPVRRERVGRIRQSIAAQMTKAAQTIPHVTNFDDADITRLDALRRDVPPDALAEGVRLTLMPMVLRAAALTLRRHPVLNAALDEEQQEIVYKQYINLGVAVDTPRGLVVPVLRQVDQMGIVEMARRLLLGV